MKYKFIVCYFLFLMVLQSNAQQKKWYNKYWAGANVGMLLGINKQSPSIAFNAGKTLGKYKVGLDYQLVEFAIPIKVKTLSFYFDKAIDGKKNQLFFYVMPGLSFIANGKNALAQTSRYSYSKSNPGIGLQFGSGIKWKVKTHNVYLSGGYSITKYSINANEYPEVINPYNPTSEETILHKYKFRYNKIQVRLGFQL